MINLNHDHVYKRELFDFVFSIFDIAQYRNEQGYKLIVIINQAGIDKGYYTEDNFQQLSVSTRDLLSAIGAPIKRVSFPLNHQTVGIGEYLGSDIFRRPQLGLLFQLQKVLDLDLDRSAIIGDKARVIRTGIAHGA